jgi:hypothetical protein
VIVIFTVNIQMDHLYGFVIRGVRFFMLDVMLLSLYFGVKIMRDPLRCNYLFRFELERVVIFFE